MSDRASERAGGARWRDLSIVGADGAQRRAWECTSCCFVLGGPALTQPPSRCPMCSVAAGFPIAVVPDRPERVTILVLDRRMRELIESYRAAKREHDADAGRGDAPGHYDLDESGYGAGRASEESGAREQHLALAVADATLDRSRASRPSSPRISRPSQA